MSTGPLVTLARVTFPHEAHLLKGLLESRGVTAFDDDAVDVGDRAGRRESAGCPAGY